MDRTTPLSSTPSNTNPNPNTNPRIENVAQTAHKVVDTVAEFGDGQPAAEQAAHQTVDPKATVWVQHHLGYILIVEPGPHG